MSLSCAVLHFEPDSWCVWRECVNLTRVLVPAVSSNVATPEEHPAQVGEYDVAIDDIAAIAKLAGNAIMEIYTRYCPSRYCHPMSLSRSREANKKRTKRGESFLCARRKTPLAEWSA